MITEYLIDICALFIKKLKTTLLLLYTRRELEKKEDNKRWRKKRRGDTDLLFCSLALPMRGAKSFLKDGPLKLTRPMIVNYLGFRPYFI